MRIGVISDTHSNTNAIDRAVEMAGEIDLWLHAGDLIRDAEYLKMIYGVKLINVAGNCDWGNETAPEEEFIVLPQHKIFLTHGHLYGVKRSLKNIIQVGKKNSADIIIFGHTHVACIEKEEGITILNPGSLSYPRDGKGQSFMVVELNDDAEPEIYQYYI